MGNKYTIESYLENKTPISSYRLKNKLFQYRLKERKCESCKNETWLNYPIALELHHMDGNPNNNNINNLQILCPNCHSLTENYRGANKKTNSLSIEETKTLIQDSTSINQVIQKMGFTAQKSHYANVRTFMNKYGVSLRSKTEEEILEEKKNMKEIGIERERIKAFQRNSPIREKAWFESRKVERPTKNELLKMVWERSVLKIAKELKVSDNAVRKWATIYNIPVPPIGWWAKWNNGHFEECLKIKKEMFIKYKVGAEGFEASLDEA